ncbi:BQ5605_C024g09888 [Microbotryum silenes-dioicae]|uniref:BQ5605_C024g09888 protein n=1 Tax=Microbotryum silenes-dioicae TaxID=796604 RepID=A0A2X0MLV7_9BASI|nr:BQ5605_C024g09888 [Microbotryum silenes-dioicae]
MTLGSMFKNRPRDIMQRYQDAALGPNDKACNRPDLIARVFEAKSGSKRHAGCFGDECRMNGFCFFFVLGFLT